MGAFEEPVFRREAYVTMVTILCTILHALLALFWGLLSILVHGLPHKFFKP